MRRALFAALKGWQQTAPLTATRAWQRWLFVRERGWTYEQYDACAAADLLLDAEFSAMVDGLRNGK
jgi:hypothetical protein